MWRLTPGKGVCWRRCWAELPQLCLLSNSLSGLFRFGPCVFGWVLARWLFLFTDLKVRLYPLHSLALALFFVFGCTNKVTP